MSTKKILIAEDNDDNRIVYATMLEHHGYEVVSTANGAEVQALAVKESPDLVLMDVSLPGMNGWDATELLKSKPETSHIPVIAITAHALPEDRHKATQVGCDGYLSKPVGPRRVLEEVNRMVNGGG